MSYYTDNNNFNDGNMNYDKKNHHHNHKSPKSSSLSSYKNNTNNNITKNYHNNPSPHTISETTIAMTISTPTCITPTPTPTQIYTLASWKDSNMVKYFDMRFNFPCHYFLRLEETTSFYSNKFHLIKHQKIKYYTTAITTSSNSSLMYNFLR